MMKKLFRTVGLCFAAGLLAICLYLTCITEVQKTWMDLDAGDFFGHTTDPLYEGTVYSQHFIAQRSMVDEMQVRIVTWEREYSPEDWLKVSLVADISGETIAECQIPLSDFEDNRLYTLPFSDARLIRGTWYTLRFSGNALEESHSVSIMLSDRGRSGWEYCTKDNEDVPLEYDLSVVIRGRGTF